MLWLNKRYQNTVVFKNLTEFLRLDVNALRFKTSIIFIFPNHFLRKWLKIFPLLFSMLPVEVPESKIGTVTLEIYEKSGLQILLIFVQNALGQLKHKQTLKYTRKMHAAM